MNSIAGEMINTVVTAAWQFFCGLVDLAWYLLPEIIELKKIAGFFTPTNVLAICLGVPTAVVSILKILSKIDLPQNDYS